MYAWSFNTIPKTDTRIVFADTIALLAFAAQRPFQSYLKLHTLYPRHVGRRGQQSVRFLRPP
jgi:hypothetical protein